MKTLKFIGMILLAITLCTNFTACSDDDNPQIPTSITGTTWEGVDEYGYKMIVDVQTSTEGAFTVYEPETDKLYYTMPFTYLFNRETGEVVVQYGNDVLTGQINGNDMTIDYYNTILTFRKQ